MKTGTEKQGPGKQEQRNRKTQKQEDLKAGTEKQKHWKTGTCENKVGGGGGRDNEWQGKTSEGIQNNRGKHNRAIP